MVDVVASNVIGLGASHLVASLLPAIERVGGDAIERIWLPDRGLLSSYFKEDDARHRIYHRRLPNSASRLVEALLTASRVHRDRDLLILGDIPLATHARQVVFVHNPFLLPSSPSLTFRDKVNRSVLRKVFARNLRFAERLIVQTDVMAERLAEAYPQAASRISVVRQPPPSWLMNGDAAPPTAASQPHLGMRLFFPSDASPHKNHKLIVEALKSRGIGSIVHAVEVTVDSHDLPENLPLLQPRGRLGEAEMRQAYARADALLFPSLEESYGLPLVEAIHLGLPIICADRPYARTLCGDVAIYFDPFQPQSLVAAIEELHGRLTSGWSPDWSKELAKFPPDWNSVARAMLAPFGVI